MKHSYYYCKNPACPRPSGVCGYLFPSKEHGVVCQDCHVPEVITGRLVVKRGKAVKPHGRRMRKGHGSKAKRGIE